MARNSTDHVFSALSKSGCARILGTLCGFDRALNLSEINDRSGLAVSTPAISKILAKLTHTRLVEKTPRGYHVIDETIDTLPTEFKIALGESLFETVSNARSPSRLSSSQAARVLATINTEAKRALVREMHGGLIYRGPAHVARMQELPKKQLQDAQRSLQRSHIVWDRPLYVSLLAGTLAWIESLHCASLRYQASELQTAAVRVRSRLENDVASAPTDLLTHAHEFVRRYFLKLPVERLHAYRAELNQSYVLEIDFRRDEGHDPSGAFWYPGHHQFDRAALDARGEFDSGDFLRAARSFANDLWDFPCIALPNATE